MASEFKCSCIWTAAAIIICLDWSKKNKFIVSNINRGLYVQIHYIHSDEWLNASSLFSVILKLKGSRMPEYNELLLYTSNKMYIINCLIKSIETLENMTENTLKLADKTSRSI